MIVLPFSQHSEEWYWARISRLTGSQIAKIIWEQKTLKSGELSTVKTGYDPAISYIKSKVQGLFLEKLPEETQSKAIAWGNEHEFSAIQHYCKLNGYKIEDWELTKCILKDDKTPLLVSPDAYNLDIKKSLEVKCPLTVSKFSDTCDIKTVADLREYDKDYFWQCISELWITETESIDFVNFHPFMKEGHKMNILTIHRNEVLFDIALFETRLQWAVDVYMKTYNKRIEKIK